MVFIDIVLYKPIAVHLQCRLDMEVTIAVIALWPTELIHYLRDQTSLTRILHFISQKLY